jgi:hypothetical protein
MNHPIERAPLGGLHRTCILLLPGLFLTACFLDIEPESDYISEEECAGVYVADNPVTGEKEYLHLTQDSMYVHVIELEDSSTLAEKGRWCAYCPGGWSFKPRIEFTGLRDAVSWRISNPMARGNHPSMAEIPQTHHSFPLYKSDGKIYIKRTGSLRDAYEKVK